MGFKRIWGGVRIVRTVSRSEALVHSSPYESKDPTRLSNWNMEYVLKNVGRIRDRV